MLRFRDAAPPPHPSRWTALHIEQRGHNRDACFLNEQDYLAYLGWLDEALRQTGCQLHAYVLMTNHLHLLLTPERAKTIPKLLIALGRRYVQYFNRTYKLTGTLWDSRYKSSLVQADTYLLATMRYIELNPVRSCMVDDPAHYRWSSYRANALGQAQPRVTPHPVYTDIARDESERHAAYRQLYSARNSTTTRSPTSVLPSTRACHWAAAGFTNRLNRLWANGAKQGHAGDREVPARVLSKEHSNNSIFWPTDEAGREQP